MSIVLEVQDVASGYGEVQILWGVSLRLEEGKLTTLVGSQRGGEGDAPAHGHGASPPVEGENPVSGEGHHPSTAARAGQRRPGDGPGGAATLHGDDRRGEPGDGGILPPGGGPPPEEPWSGSLTCSPV